MQRGRRLHQIDADPESNAVVSVARGYVVVAHRGTAVTGTVAPAPAPDHPATAELVAAPFPDITVHVVQTPGVGPLGPHVARNAFVVHEEVGVLTVFAGALASVDSVQHDVRVQTCAAGADAVYLAQPHYGQCNLLFIDPHSLDGVLLKRHVEPSPPAVLAP